MAENSPPASGATTSAGSAATSPGAPSASGTPAADTVEGGDLDERDAAEIARLNRELAQERQTRIDREKRISEVEDENHRLKSAGVAGPPPKPAASKSTSWWDDL